MWHEIIEAVSNSTQRRLILKLLGIYLLVALPFKALDILPDLANIRPNSAFIPIYGLLFGPVGAWTNALGNCLYDLLTGSFTKSTIAGNIANFCVPLLMYKLWQRLVGGRFKLADSRDLALYIVISATGAVAKALIITPAVMFFHPTVSGAAFAKAVVATEITFYLAPGIAILLVLQTIYGCKGYLAKADAISLKNTGQITCLVETETSTTSGMNRLQANLCLLTVVLCWSFEVILLKNIPESVPGLSVTALTNIIGSALLVLVFFSQVRQFFSLKLFIQILPLAALNTVYNLMRFEATRFLSADVVEFTTTLALVIMPVILYLFFREKQQVNVWLGGALVLFGIFCSLDWSFPLKQSYGLLLMIGFSIIWSGYIIWLNRLSKQQETITLTVFMLGAVGIISLLLWFVLSPETVTTIDYSMTFWASIFSYAYFSCSFATVLNILVQKFVSPLDAVAIYSLAPAIVLIMAVTLPPQLAIEFDLTFMAIVSCVIIAFGSFISQVEWQKLTALFTKYST